MRVSVGLKEILVHVEHESINDKIIRQYVAKNFSNTLHFSTAILVFNEETERYKRQFFLQWLFASYKKVNPALPSSFKTNLLKRGHLPIKIRITDKKEVLHSFNISLKPIDTHVVVCRLDMKNYLMLNYLKLIFRKELLKKSKDGLAFSIKLESTAAREKLSKLIGRKKVLNFPVTFWYDELWMHDFLDKAPRETPRFQVQNYGDALIGNAYRLLKSSPNDSLEVIKKRYILLVKKFHPDRIYHEDRLKVAEFTEKFQRVQRAYEAVKKDKMSLFSIAS